jgi:hypothetical protein
LSACTLLFSAWFGACGDPASAPTNEGGTASVDGTTQGSDAQSPLEQASSGDAADRSYDSQSPSDGQDRADLQTPGAMDGSTDAGPVGDGGCMGTQIRCGTACVQPATDRTNCGGCGNSCGTGGTCASGICTCAVAAVICGASCAELASDPNNCGACGKKCAMGTVACGVGVCQTTTCDGGPCCAAGLSRCPAGRGAMIHCVDLQTDPANCGACGTSCPAGMLHRCGAGTCL